MEKTRKEETKKISTKIKRKFIPEAPKYQEKNLMEFLMNKFKALEKNLNLDNQKKENIVFWMNSVEDKKLEIKISEFQKLLSSGKVIYWFALYLVYKRIPYEPSIQNTYRKLIIRSHIKLLYYEVYDKTMRMINSLMDFVTNKDILLSEE